MKIKQSLYTFSIILAILALKCLLAHQNVGHTIDINTFLAWFERFDNKTFHNFYEEGYFLDYPAGYLYVFYLIHGICRLLSVHESQYYFVIKMFPVLCDTAAALIVFHMARRKWGIKIGWALMIFYALNPVIVMNSSVWGQVDSVFALVLLFAVIAMEKEKSVWVGALYALLALLKPQAFIFAPLLIIYLVNRFAIKKIGAATASGIVVFILAWLPFIYEKPVFWLINFYKTSMTSYHLTTFNAFNVYAMIGKNATPTNSLINLINIAVVCLIVFVCFLLWRKLKNSSETLYAAAACFLSASTFLFVTNMHERYLYPFILLALILYIKTENSKLWFAVLGFALTNFINVYWLYKEALKKNYYIDAQDPLMIFLSATNILIFALFCFAVFGTREKETETLLKGDKMRNMKVGAKTLLWIIVLAYSAISFVNLGDTKVPKTSETFNKETVEIEFSKTTELASMSIYFGHGEGSFDLEILDANGRWQNKGKHEQNYIAVFCWNKIELNSAASAVKLIFKEGTVGINEIAFYGADGKSVLPNRAAAQNGKQIKNLFDEQKLASKENTYMNSTYFDEIYFARTAYEHLNGLNNYENTHPPLGKLLIGSGIFLFGMSPFGWRVVGALFGIAMIPLIYWLARKIFKNEKIALFASVLMAADCMHFAQTRIGTIDGFLTFFIMLMFGFMYLYFKESAHENFKRKIEYLFLSGLFFGLGAATKWIAVYGALGLFVIFAWSFVKDLKRYKEIKRKALNQANAKAKREMSKQAQVSHKRLFQQIVFGFLAFVALPSAIYYLSFIPIMRLHGQGFDLGHFIGYQRDMYNYHANLHATHPFSSPWWSWMIEMKPIWYYAGAGAQGEVSDIVSLGNPVIWWAGIPALIFAVYSSVKEKDENMKLVLIGFFSQMIPWIFIHRITFIYHFFSALPFLILMISWILNKAKDKSKLVAPLYLSIAAVVFMMFYPILSGTVVPKGYVEHFLKWMPTWIF